MTTSGGLGNIILVGSHADLRAHKTAQGDFVYPAGETLLQSIRSLYGSFFQIHNQVNVFKYKLTHLLMK